MEFVKQLCLKTVEVFNEPNGEKSLKTCFEASPKKVEEG